MASPTRPFLVFSSVGKSSRHLQWLQGRVNFDLALVDYEPEPCWGFDVRWNLWHHPGAKWPNFEHFLQNFPGAQEYRGIAVLDDDLEVSGEELSLAFDLFQEHELWLAQPSLRPGSAYSWMFTLQRPYLTLRYTSFVENGLCLLRGQDLDLLRPAFRRARSGYGLDWALPQLLGAGRQQVAVLDEVAVYHPARDSSLDRLWQRQEHQQHGLELCQALGVTPLKPQEFGYLLNAAGERWSQECGDPEVVYAAATRFVHHQSRRA